MVAPVNPNASHIWDEAETWVIEAKDVPGDDITAFLPTSLDDDLEELGWAHVGLLDASAGIPVTPEMEINHYDGFGHSRYRSKGRKGSLTTGFTALEDNVVTRKFVLPGSASNKIGAPRSVYFWILYVLRDEDIVTDIRVSTRPALLELTNHSGAVEGEQEMYEITCHHANDSNRDVFTRVAVALVIVTNALPAGVVGTPYIQELESAGGEGEKTWTKTGTLPAGLTLFGNGTLAGTPTAAGTPSITFKVTDSATPPVEVTKAITVTVTAS